MDILLLFSLLSALLAPGNSLQCYECLSLLGPCNGSLTTCGPSDDACVNVITSFKLLGKSGTLQAKSCLEETSRQIRPSVATFQPDSSLRTNFTYCNEDGCNHGVPEVPVSRSESNGRMCPSCRDLGGKKCKSTKTIPCTGNDDQCIEFTGILVAGNVTLLKSAFSYGSPGICDKRFGVTKYTKNIFDLVTNVDCYPAPHQA